MASTIWITRWLCPRRHAAFALLWNAKEITAAKIEAQGEQLFVDHGGEINRLCDICQSQELKPESAATQFKTIGEAALAGATMAAQQIMTRIALDKLREQNRN